jgi:heat shock protein HslJ/serine/threonine protein kinase
MALFNGQLLNNRYRILRLLGQGGMGAVYLADDGNLPGKQVAIKENLDLSQAAQDQFKREAVILARLKHPSLPQVTDHFVLPTGAQYLVMEYVDGEDLDQALARRGPLPEAEVLGWMGQVLDALEYMHTWVDPATGQVTPVVHRDIKPGNIKRTPQGRIMLVDFGIAKYQQAGGTLTGARAASPGFSPLEQYTGGTDVRSDIYSLGATLYCLLTGQVPPEAPDLAAGRTPLPPLRAVASAVSANTETVILRAMQLPVAGRYQSVADLRLALTPGAWQACPVCNAMNRTGARFCHNCGGSLVVAATASNPTLVTPRPPWWGRRNAQIALVAIAAVVLLATGALASRLSMRPASGEPTSTRVAVVALMTGVPTTTRASITTTRTATPTVLVTPSAAPTVSRTPMPSPTYTVTRTATPSSTPTTPLSLTDGTWLMTAYNNGKQAVVSGVADTEVTAVFGADGTLSGSAGCNRYNAPYTMDGNKITIGAPTTTRMMCPQPIMEQEAQYLAAIQLAATYNVQGSRLDLRSAEDALQATYTQQPAATPPAAATTPAQPTGASALVGPTWLMTAYNNGKGGLVSALPDVEVTAIFGADGQLSGSAGCNNYGAPYTVDGNKIKIGPGMSTMMACPQPIMDQETAYLAALQTAATYKIEGKKLELRTAAGTLAVSYEQ